MDKTLKIWRLHPDGVRIIPAEKTLNGTAHAGGVKFCHPFKTANSSGFWTFPPADIDVMWTKNGFKFNHVSNYSSADAHLVHSLSKHPDIENFCPASQGRNKYSWGTVEENVMQIWTGCIFQTPPGWNLHVRSPINFMPRPACFIMEGTLETDWMQYDIWLNVVFTKENEWVKFRRNEWPPLAQLIPVKRTDAWDVSEEIVSKENTEARRVFDFWVQYNQKKFCSGGKQYMNSSGRTKDSTTYYKERQRILDKEGCPQEKQMKPPPLAPSRTPPKKKSKKLTPRFVKKNNQ